MFGTTGIRAWIGRHLALVWLGVLAQLGCFAWPGSAHAQANNLGAPYTVDETANNFVNRQIGTYATLNAAFNAGRAQFYADVGGPTTSCPPRIYYSPESGSVFEASLDYSGVHDAPSCPAGGIDVYAKVINYDLGKNAGGCSCTGGVNPTLKFDPINTATGNKFEQETDYTAPDDWLTLRRFYNSLVAVNQTSLGTLWRHSFDRSLQLISSTQINHYRPDGRFERFQKSNGVWTADADVSDTLSETDDAHGNPTAYTVRVAATRQTETYDTNGLLRTLLDPSGQQMSFTYSTTSTPASIAPVANLLLTINDPKGRTLSFIYNSNGLLHTVTQPDGGVVTYGYDTSGDLTSVQYPDGKTRQYVYNESAQTGGANLPGALTGEMDETGARYATTTYNANSQATSASLAGGVNLGTVNYGATDGSAPTAMTNALGASTSLSFKNILGGLKVAGSTQACGQGCNQPWAAQTYDANGYQQSATDFNGNVTKTTYDANGLLDLEIDASGTAQQRTITTTWNTALRVPLTRTVQDNNSNAVASTAWVYNSAGQTLARCEIDPTNAAASGYVCSNGGSVPAGVRRWTYTYCTAVDTTQCPIVGLLLTTTGPRTDLTQTTSYSYYLTASAVSCGTPGAACYQPGDLKSVTNALGQTTTYASYDGTGRVTRSIDANGVVTDLTYTPRGWLASRILRANANGSASSGDATTSITYTPYGAVATVTDPDGVVITYGYDQAHRLTKITDALGNYIQYTLDASGNRTAENTYAAGSTTASRSLSRIYNTLGQLTKITDGLGQVVFDASASGNYDGNGNLVQSKDANGFVQQNSYDALDRLTKTIANYNGTDAATKNTTTQSVYDALDRLTQVIDPSGLATTYGYDGLSNTTSLQSPDTGTSGNTYDAAGNVLTHTDAKGIVATNTYDALDRLTSTSYADSTLNVTYHYDESNSTTGCPSSYPTGRLTRVVENNAGSAYCYDTHGNVIQKQQVTQGQSGINQYAYTAADRLAAEHTADGALIGYVYSSNGTLSQVQAAAPGQNASAAASAISWLPFGPLSSYTLGNGQTITRSYDTNYALTDLVSPALTLHFARDLMGNISAEGNATGASPAAESYTYDPLYRLTTVAQGSTNIETLTYNPTGDRTSKAGGGLATGAYGYQANTHWLTSIGSAARAYDANGNTTGSSSAGQTWGYGYNGRNRMTTVQANGSTVASYLYNAFGQRLGKQTAAGVVLFSYDEAGHLLGEYGSNNRDYVWMGDIPLAVIDTAGSTSTVNYVTADHLGTPRAVSNSAGATIWSWTWLGNPFGELAPSSASGYTLNLRYPGQYYDTESGFNYNINRNYDSSSGRYVQSDLIGLGGEISTYAYAVGAPINAFDPNGLKVKFANPKSQEAGILRKAYNRVRKTRKGAFICKLLEQSDKLYTIDTAANGPLINSSNPFLRAQPSYTNHIDHVYIDPYAHPLENTKIGLMPASTEDLLGHEMGHLATGIMDTGPGNMDNVNANENPIRRELGEPERVTYDPILQ